MADTDPSNSERETQEFDASSADGETRRQRLTGLARMAHYRLVIPIARGRHDGVPTARGTAIGLAFGLTPTVGVQMPLIFLFWALAKWFVPKWKFSLIIAFAWTWPTNILTAPAYYYLCLITGRLLMGETAALEFEAFEAQVEGLLAQDAGLLESLWIYTVEIFRTWGIPLFLGSVPYAVAGTWAGYVLTLKFVAKLRTQQRKQMLKRRAKRARAREAAREAEEAARPED
jgi:uncharacterized protein (DUF2062 family)